MKIQWTILIITAITDLIIAGGGALSAAMVATGSTTMPNDAAVLFAIISGLIIAARTVQQKLATTPEAVAGLRGDPPPHQQPQPVTIQQPKSQPVPVQEQPTAAKHTVK